MAHQGLILVTGGAGYIGSHTLLALAGAGYETLTVDNLSLGRAGAVLAGRLIELDLRDRAGLARIFEEYRPAGVIHFAALSLVGQSVDQPRLYFENNVIGGLNLFGLAAEAGAPVVFSSSCAVYGLPERLPLTEDHPRRPISPYGLTKLILEQALAEYHRAHGLAYASLRYFNAAGADPQGRLGEDHDPETHLIPLVLNTAAGRREVLTVFGDDYPTADGTCVRDYIHVADLAEAHLAALNLLQRRPAGLALNLGAGRGLSVRRIIDLAGRVTGRDIPVRIAPRRPGDPPELTADISRAAEILDWRPRRTEPEIIIGDAWRRLCQKEGL